MQQHGVNELTNHLQITSFNTALPLKLQYHAAVGYVVCFAAMLGIYYTNAWDAKSQPFMSTQLRSENGSKYPTSSVFVDGVLDEAALEKYGAPRLTGSFAYSMFMANAAVSICVARLHSLKQTNLLVLDRCFGLPLLPLLGRRCRQSFQERETR
jgi:hypothetical protein